MCQSLQSHGIPTVHGTKYAYASLLVQENDNGTISLFLRVRSPGPLAYYGLHASVVVLSSAGSVGPRDIYAGFFQPQPKVATYSLGTYAADCGSVGISMTGLYLLLAGLRETVGFSPLSAVYNYKC